MTPMPDAHEAQARSRRADAGSLILHHYALSPFSEKVRVALGIKGLDWFSCAQPAIMPKPELVTLTGGYRRIPVLQIGADIYCDTQIIVRELERRFPTPTLFPAGDGGLGYGLGFWSDRAIFNAVVAVLFGGGFTADEAFVKDRSQMSGRPFDIAAMQRAAPIMQEQLRAHFDMVETQLADGRHFLTGDAPALADADVYHNVAFLRWGPAACGRLLDHFPRLLAWEARIKALGHGSSQPAGRDEALDIARDAQSPAETWTDPAEPNGWKAGDIVAVSADDYGRDAIIGELVSSSAQHISLRRSSPRTGEVVVHFPRAGFHVRKPRL